MAWFCTRIQKLLEKVEAREHSAAWARRVSWVQGEACSIVYPFRTVLFARGKGSYIPTALWLDLVQMTTQQRLWERETFSSHMHSCNSSRLARLSTGVHSAGSDSVPCTTEFVVPPGPWVMMELSHPLAPKRLKHWYNGVGSCFVCGQLGFNPPSTGWSPSLPAEFPEHQPKKMFPT